VDGEEIVGRLTATFLELRARVLNSP